jgi:hypothetical protein
MGVVFHLFAFFVAFIVSFLVCISLLIIYLSLIILANRAFPGYLLCTTLAENKLEVTVIL